MVGRNGFRALLAAVSALIACALTSAHADDIPKTDAERLRVIQSLKWQAGPRLVAIPGASAEFDLPKDMIAVTGRDARRAYLISEAIDSEDIQAVILAPQQKFLIAVFYTADGYVRMDDWPSFDASALLEQDRRRLIKNNEKRKSIGQHEYTNLQWEISPRLNREQAIVYSATSFKVDAEDVINIVAYRLGRMGTLMGKFAVERSVYENNPQILGIFENNLRFKQGGRYEDYRSGDPVAPIGVAQMMMKME